MKKSLMVSGMQFGTEFLTNLYKEVVKRGGTEEGIFEAFKTGSDLIPKFAEMIVEATSGVRKLVLKSLKIIAIVMVNANPVFSKKFFSGPVKFFFGSNFSSWVLGAMPNVAPAFKGALLKTQLTKYMCNSEILDELGHPKPFTISEFAVIICDLILKQPNGENGTLLNNCDANIFFVQLENDRIVVVNVRWRSDFRGWRLFAHDLDDVRWDAGRCVFSRN